MTSRLRDLAAQIETLAREHSAYSQAWQPVRNLVDHLCALARVEETNHGELGPHTVIKGLPKHVINRQCEAEISDKASREWRISRDPINTDLRCLRQASCIVDNKHMCGQHAGSYVLAQYKK